MYYTILDSPIGPLMLAGDGETLSVVGFSRGKKSRGAEPAWQRRDDAFGQARRELLEYFDGRRQHFDVALRPEGTEFQRAVWQALTEIPYGATCSYQEIAERIGKPKASRAVGMANFDNLAICPPSSRLYNNTVGGRPHIVTVRSLEIDTGVHCAAARERIRTNTKSACHPVFTAHGVRNRQLVERNHKLFCLSNFLASEQHFVAQHIILEVWIVRIHIWSADWQVFHLCCFDNTLGTETNTLDCPCGNFDALLRSLLNFIKQRQLAVANSCEDRQQVS